MHTVSSNMHSGIPERESPTTTPEALYKWLVSLIKPMRYCGLIKFP